LAVIPVKGQPRRKMSLPFLAVSDNSGGEPDGRVMLWPTTSGQMPFNETL
jgi:hypothetical protein